MYTIHNLYIYSPSLPWILLVDARNQCKESRWSSHSKYPKSSSTSSTFSWRMIRPSVPESWELQPNATQSNNNICVLSWETIEVDSKSMLYIYTWINVAGPPRISKYFLNRSMIWSKWTSSTRKWLNLTLSI